MASKLAACYGKPEVIEKIVKRLLLAMDLLIVAEFEKDYSTAAACFDIIGWQLLEFVRKKRPDKRPLEGNMWRRLARKSKNNEAIYVDRKGREFLLNCYLNLRTEQEGGKKRKEAVGQKSEKMIPLIGHMIDCSFKEMNKVIAIEFGGEIKKVEEESEWKGLREPIVVREIPRIIAENTTVNKKEKSKTTEQVKNLLEESEKILSAVTLEHQTSDSGSLSIYKESYEKWIDSMFDFHHAKKGSGKLDVLLVSTENYDTVRSVLKAFNVFEEQSLEKPKGSYTEVKCSDYFVAKYLKWKMTQELYAIRQKVKWDFNREDLLKLHLVVMQIFCLLCTSVYNFVEHKEVVEGFKKSADKLRYVQSLESEKKIVLNTFNIISLRLYKFPYRAVVDCIDEDSISSEEENGEDDEKTQEYKDVEKEKKKKKSKPVKNKDGSYAFVLDEYYLGNLVFADVHARLEEEVKRLSCVDLRKRMVKMDKKDEEEFFKLMDEMTEGLNSDETLSGKVYKDDYRENFEEGLQSVLEHYLKIEEKN